MNVDKILFWDARKKENFTNELNNQMKMKNRLLRLIISNEDKKTSRTESNNKAFKFEQQIALLQQMSDFCGLINSREDINKINAMIDAYNSLSR